jgi:hypothetical protein
MESIRSVEEILRRWDPIGVEPGKVAPADEYDSYAPYLVSMVQNGCTVAEVAARLEYLATETMGLNKSTPQGIQHNLEFANQIVSTLRPSNTSLERTREG